LAFIMTANAPSTESLKKTSLDSCHLAAKAKMAPFAGFLMPIQYQGIIAEHVATRTKAGIFDTCHMGEFLVHGTTALADLEKLLSAPVHSIRIGQCRYNLLCNDRGGVIDDLICYRLAEERFFLVVNAATQQGDFAWLQAHRTESTAMENLSEQTAKIDLQGPGSPKIAQKLVEGPLASLGYFRFMQARYRGQEVMVSRTGYTGEIGFEVYCDHALAIAFWNDCLQLGAEPAGLGARDTLRLEMALPLYGHELSAERNAGESGLSRSIATDKEFIGCSAVRDPSRLRSLLVCLSLEGRKTARAGDALVGADGQPTGSVTSGSFAPSLGHAIAMGYVRTTDSKPGTRLTIKGERGDLSAVVQEAPFYRDATARRKLEEFL
jgi:aminomethyltransferase